MAKSKANISAGKANEHVFDIFSSTKSRTIFGEDFSKMNAEQKADYVQRFFNRTAFPHQVEIVDVLTDSFEKNTTLNATRQSGKCLPEDTYITLADGSIEEIGKLPLEEPIEVATIVDGQVKTAVGVVTVTGTKRVYRNIYSSGNTLKTSDDHRLFRYLGDSLLLHDYVRSVNQLVGDRIATVFAGRLSYTSFLQRIYFGDVQCRDITILVQPVGASVSYEPNFIADGFVVHNSEALSWSQALNCIHNLYPALDNTTKVVSLANKESQSLIIGNRLRGLLEENYQRTKFFWDKAGSLKTYLSFKKEAGLNSCTTGTIQYLTANPRAFGEGFSASIINLDEAGRLDEMVYSQVVVPYGASTNAKINLTGVSRGRNVFYDACNSPDYKHLHYPWDKVETYRRAAPANLIDRITKEVVLETGLYPLRVMPLTLKKAFFPSNPIVHILPSRFQKEEQIELWSLSEGIMTEDDFRSQFCLDWLAALLAVLQLAHLQLLFESGTHAPLDHGLPGEEYFFGFDLAGTRNMYALGPSNKDTAALSIWTKRNGIKLKVFGEELYSASPEEAVQWLTQYTHPQSGIFRCKYGAVDITGAIGALTSEKLVNSKLPIIPIMYNRIEETTHKNFKNAMFDYFQIECGASRCQYPIELYTDGLDPTTLSPLYPIWKKCRDQWEVVERFMTGGINARIMAPAPEHDDFPCSDVMAVFCMDRAFQFEEFLKVMKQRAKSPVSGSSRMNLPPGPGGRGTGQRRW